jgi:hypothetical protein
MPHTSPSCVTGYVPITYIARCPLRPAGPRSPGSGELRAELADRSQVMVIVLRDEEAQVDHRHRLIETRMEGSALELDPGHRADARQELAATLTKLGEQLIDAPRIVIRVLSRPVLKIGGSERRGAFTLQARLHDRRNSPARRSPSTTLSIPVLSIASTTRSTSRVARGAA